MRPLRGVTAEEQYHIDVVAADIVDAAIAVHRRLGPGLYESAYRDELADELRERGHRVATEVPILRDSHGMRVVAYKADIVVDDLVLVELKSVPDTGRVHVAQVVTYLRYTGFRIALLLNFNVRLMKYGIRRIAL